MQTINRIKSFAWRYGLFVIASVGTYLANLGEIQDISIKKLGIWFAIITATYVGNEITKWANSKPEPLDVKIVDVPTSEIADAVVEKTEEVAVAKEKAAKKKSAAKKKKATKKKKK